MSKGREERRRSRRGGVRAPDLERLYRNDVRLPEPDDFEFDVTLIRPGAQAKRRRKMPLTNYLTQLEVYDETAVLSGYMSLRREEADDGSKLPILKGDIVRARTRYRGRRWRRWWDMRAADEPAVDLQTGTLDVELHDPLQAADTGEREWEYRKDEDSHPDAWRADEVAKDVCKRLGIPVRRLARGTVDLDAIKLTGTGLEVIREAYKQEREETSIEYVIRFRDGEFEVVPLKRNRTLYEIRNIEESAATTATSRTPSPITAIVATGRVDGEKVEIEVTAPDRALRRFGRVEDERDYGKVASREKLRDKAKRDLAKELRVKRTAELTFVCLPDLERGDTVRWRTREPGWYGPSNTSQNRQYAYPKSVRHSITPTRATTSVTLSQHDPYLADRRRRHQEAREEAEKERNAKDDDAN